MMQSTRDVLERALAQEPENLALHAAYVDWLLEAGDPRGEWIHILLALEDRQLSADQSRSLEQRADILRRQHEAEWLGPLAAYVKSEATEEHAIKPQIPQIAVTWRRGWLDHLEMDRLTGDVMNAIAATPYLNLLRMWRISHYSDMPGNDWADPAGLRAMAVQGRLTNLQSFVLGSPTEPNLSTGAGWDEILHTMGRLEQLELRCREAPSLTRPGGLFPHLRSVTMVSDWPLVPMADFLGAKWLDNVVALHLGQFANLTSQDVQFLLEPFAAFCRSPNLRHLRELSLHFSALQDDGVELLVDSGRLKQLVELDLARCNITDDGARRLASSPDIRRLEQLRLHDNPITAIGIEALLAAGAKVSPLPWPERSETLEIPF